MIVIVIVVVVVVFETSSVPGQSRVRIKDSISNFHVLRILETYSMYHFTIQYSIEIQTCSFDVSVTSINICEGITKPTLIKNARSDFGHI